MPTRPTTGAWVLGQLFGLGDQKEWSIYYWYSIFSGTPSSTWNAQTATSSLFAATGPALASMINTEWQILGMRAYFNFGSGTLGSEFYNAVPGTDTNDPLPEFTTVVVRKLSATFSADAKGIWKIPGVCEDMTTGSYLNSTGETAYQSIADGWRMNVTDQGIVYAPATFSKKTGLLYPILSCAVTARMGTDRRRRFRF